MTCIGPAGFAALYAVDSSTGLLLIDLTDNFAREANALIPIKTESSPATNSLLLIALTIKQRS
ncbi:MAG: hypothetical protein ABFC94_17025 [Syntrophomonas sp.]